MKNIAVLNNKNEVVNIVVCESLDLAKEITGEFNLVEYGNDTLCGINAIWDGNSFIHPDDVITFQNPSE